MKFYLPPNLRILENLGRGRLGSSEFNQITAANDIDVTIASCLIKGGFYFFSPVGRHTIVISSSSTDRLWVGWHEFGHYLQNYWKPRTTAAGCELGKQSILEKQANAFANIATIENLKYKHALDFVDLIMGGGLRNKR